MTALTSVVSSGLPDAAVATGTCAIAWKLPAFAGSVGTDAHPGPNSAAIAGALLAIPVAAGAGVPVAPVLVSASSLWPQAASPRQIVAALATAIIRIVRMVKCPLIEI
ncbi:hypothetical protein JCM9534A_08540 [Catenuloplanes indicus JCM 9534]